MTDVKIEVSASADEAALRAAHFVAAQARHAVARRNRFLMAVSGGSTPHRMLQALAGEDVPWTRVHVLQVDERVAPAGDPDRNLTRLRESLLTHLPRAAAQIHPMPVDGGDLESAAARYAETVEKLAGSPPVLDLVHLGLGHDGHTASLVPGDPVLDMVDVTVAVTGRYQGRRRMTLTFSVLDRARHVLWLVTGGDKAEMLARLQHGDDTIPAGRVRSEDAVVFADRSAAAFKRES